MAVVPRKLKNQTVFYVTQRIDGVQVWEHAGTDKREAQRRDRAMKREIDAGTYVPKGTGAVTVGTFAKAWFLTRKNRSADNDQGLWRNHIEGRCPWFLDLRLDDVRTMHVVRLVEELGQPYVRARSGQPFKLSGKSVFLVFTVLNTMFRDARIAEKMIRNPCEMPRGTFKKSPKTRRTPYSFDEVRKLCDRKLVTPEGAMLNTLLFYTGVRLGEACGRRFRDWDRNPQPLGCLTVHSQYNDQKLKTEDTEGEATRMVPVHPDLAAALEQWWAEGFEMVYCRRPTLDDFIVPCRTLNMGNHTGSTGYKLFLRTCEAAGVTPHAGAVHAARHTFISFARRGGARKDVLERITHNAAGEIIDGYTRWDWEPLCEAVACFMAGPYERLGPSLRKALPTDQPIDPLVEIADGVSRAAQYRA